MNDIEALAWLNNAMQDAISDAFKPLVGKPFDAERMKSVIVDAASVAYRTSLDELIQVVPKGHDPATGKIEFDLAMPQWLAVQIGLEKEQ